MNIWDDINPADPERLSAAHEQWRKPPRELVEQKPKGGTTLDYLGHAALTEILLRVDPLWRWNFVGMDENRSPIIDRDKDGRPIGMWIELVLCGHRRYGYGSVDPSSRQSDGDRIKELIGDGLRNAAMRFGIALDLWSKADLSSATMSDGRGGDVTSSPGTEGVHRSGVGAAPTSSPEETNADVDAMVAALKALAASDKADLLNNLRVLEGGDLGPKPSLKKVADLLILHRIDPADPVTSTAEAAFTQIQNDEQHQLAMEAERGS